MTFQAFPPDPANAHGQCTHVSGPQKSHLLPIIQWEVQGREHSSIIAKLEPDWEINIGAVSAGKLCNQQGCPGREGGAAGAILCLRLCVLKTMPAVFISGLPAHSIKIHQLLGSRNISVSCSKSSTVVQPVFIECFSGGGIFRLQLIK